MTITEAVPATEKLTDRQYRVMARFEKHPRDLILELAGEGLTDKDIAARIGISERSLKIWKKQFRLKRGRRFGLLHDASANSD